MSPRADLLVLGGGPAGAALAGSAAGAGLRVVLIDKARFPRDKLCGDFVSAEGCRVLERLGLLHGLFERGAVPIERSHLTDLSGVGPEIPLPDLDGLGSAGIGVSRSLLDTTLIEEAAHRGVEIRTGVRAEEPIVEAGRVLGLKVRRKDGRIGAVRAPLVVAADGRRSLLVRRLHPGLGDPTRTDPGSWFGLKTRLEGARRLLGNRVELHLFHGGYVGLAPIEAGRTNLCMMVTVQALRECGNSPARLFDERIRSHPAIETRLPSGVSGGRWFSLGPLRFGPRLPAAAGALFVGDAAGTVDPFCGEGVSNGLRSAELALPTVLAATERGGLHADLATDYTRRWFAAFGPVSRRTRRIGRVLERPRLAGPLLRLLSGVPGPLAAMLMHATRTGMGR